LVHEDFASFLGAQEGFLLGFVGVFFFAGIVGGFFDQGERIGCLVQAPEFTQLAECGKALGGGGEGDEGEGVPEVFAEFGGNRLFAKEGELAE